MRCSIVVDDYLFVHLDLTLRCGEGVEDYVEVVEGFAQVLKVTHNIQRIVVDRMVHWSVGDGEELRRGNPQVGQQQCSSNCESCLVG